MTEPGTERNELDERAAKLDERARKLDEVAGTLQEGAAALHEVALEMKGGADGSHPGATALQLARMRADQLGRALHDSGGRAVLLLRHHPLTALTTAGIAAAFIKAPFALGLLAGVAGGAFLVQQPGARIRHTLADKSRVMLASAREAWEGNRPRLPDPAR